VAILGATLVLEVGLLPEDAAISDVLPVGCAVMSVVDVPASVDIVLIPAETDSITVLVGSAPKPESVVAKVNTASLEVEPCMVVCCVADAVADLVTTNVLLDVAAAPFSTLNQFAATGWPRPAASANPAMSKGNLADVSAGGLKDEKSSGTWKFSGWEYNRSVYRCGPSPAGGVGGR
jgi:hypothetical protein